MMLDSRAPYATGEGGPAVHGDAGNRAKKQSDETATATAEEATFAYDEPRVEIVYGTFRLNFHRFDRFELDLRGHTQP